MSTFRLNPLIILKNESERLLLAFRDNSNSNIYEFSGIVKELLNYASETKSFAASELLAKVPSESIEDFNRFWEFCMTEQIFIESIP